jgi:hypothetical protein
MVGVRIVLGLLQLPCFVGDSRVIDTALVRGPLVSGAISLAVGRILLCAVLFDDASVVKLNRGKNRQEKKEHTNSDHRSLGKAGWNADARGKGDEPSHFVRSRMCLLHP